MKSIYLLLTRSDTFLSRMISQTTEEPYTHVSISFSRSLSSLYSFGRKYADLPFPAGLIKEGLDKGFLWKHRDMPCALLELLVEDDVFFAAKGQVEEMLQQAQEYRYSVLGLILCHNQIPLERKHHYFCSQFVGKVLQESGAVELPKQPSLMHPADYFRIPGIHCLFTGSVESLSGGRYHYSPDEAWYPFRAVN